MSAAEQDQRRIEHLDRIEPVLSERRRALVKTPIDRADGGRVFAA